MSDPIPTLDTVHPGWRSTRALLSWAERAVSLLPKGTPERRKASREASVLARRWRRMLDDVDEARTRAGWFRSSPISWCRRPEAP